jgi:hypothetical protein
MYIVSKLFLRTSESTRDLFLIESPSFDGNLFPDFLLMGAKSWNIFSFLKVGIVILLFHQASK